MALGGRVAESVIFNHVTTGSVTAFNLMENLISYLIQNMSIIALCLYNQL